MKIYQSSHAPNASLSRENRTAAPVGWAHPRHRLAEVRARLVDAGVGARNRARGMTCLRTADAGAGREVFVTTTNMERGSDIFNPGEPFDAAAGRNLSRDQVTNTMASTGDRLR